MLIFLPPYLVVIPIWHLNAYSKYLPSQSFVNILTCPLKLISQCSSRKENRTGLHIPARGREGEREEEGICHKVGEIPWEHTRHRERQTNRKMQVYWVFPMGGSQISLGD